MASLADELDLDPAFDNVSMASGMDQSPPRIRGARRGRGARGRRASRQSSDGDREQGPSTLDGAGEGFSLADELGGGNQQGQEATGPLFASEASDHHDDRSDGALARQEAVDDETKARRDQEHFLISSDILNESLRTTEAFLAMLKRTSTGSGSGKGGLSLPSASSNSSLFASGGPADDTSSLEGTAGHIVKQMREYSHEREDQIRELQECDRLLRRAFEEGGDWISAIANVDEFEESEGKSGEEDDDRLGFGSETVQVHKRQSVRESSAASRETAGLNGALFEDEGPELANPSTSFGRSPLSAISINDQRGDEEALKGATTSSKPTIYQQMVSLQHSTTDLVHSLGSIHEQSQVARASMNDAARRIKSIKTVLTNWNAELQAVEQSQSWISSWESGSLDAVTRPKDIQEWTRGHMDKFQRILNDADVKARELLSPIHDPTLDQLATAQG